jgi:hypothetical protein
MPTKSAKNSRAGASPELPHSWSLSTWPETVWPNKPAPARWILRSYRRELIAAGALARTGKALIVLGRGYARWLSQRAAGVEDFESNNPAMRPADARRAAA